MTAIMRTLALLGALVLSTLGASAQQFPSGYLQANSGASAAPARAVSATAWLDRWAGSTSGFVICRDGSVWSGKTPTNCGLQPYDAELAALAGLTSASGKVPYFTGSGTADVADSTSYGRSLLNAANASALRALAGTVIGTDVQAFDADLAALAGLTSANNKCFYWTGSATAANVDCTIYGRSVWNVADASALRTLAGLVIGTDVLSPSQASQTITGGVNITSLSQSTGNLTFDPGARPLQYITNGGAFTLTAPSNDGSGILLVTNNGSAGTITFTGFSVGSSTGDTLSTTNTHKFSIHVWRINGTSGYRIAAHQ